VVPESPAHHLCWVPIRLEDMPQVVLFSNQFGGITNIFGFGPQALMMLDLTLENGDGSCSSCTCLYVSSYKI